MYEWNKLDLAKNVLQNIWLMVNARSMDQLTLFALSSLVLCVVAGISWKYDIYFRI